MNRECAHGLTQGVHKTTDLIVFGGGHRGDDRNTKIWGEEKTTHTSKNQGNADNASYGPGHNPIWVARAGLSTSTYSRAAASFCEGARR